MMHKLLPALLLFAACGGSKSDKPAPAPASGSPAAPASGAAPATVAAPSAPARPTFATYQDALKGGRKLTKEGKLAEAKAAFEAALALQAEDAVALSELGFVEAKLGNDDAALAATDRSIVAASEPKIKAASLYNKGRLLEKKGDLDGARAAYTESLSLRPNDTVQKRLDQLGDAAATTVAADLGAVQFKQDYKKVRDVPWETQVHACGAGCKATVHEVIYGDVDGDGSDEALVILEGPFDAPADHNGHLYGVAGGKVVHLGRARSGGNEHPEFAPRFVDAKLGGGAAKVTWTWQLWGNCDDDPDLCKETVVETYKLVDGKAVFEEGEPVGM